MLKGLGATLLIVAFIGATPVGVTVGILTDSLGWGALAYWGTVFGIGGVGAWLNDAPNDDFT